MNQMRENGQSCDNWVASYWTKGRKFRFIGININPDWKTVDIVNFPCSTILLHVLETGYGINEILHPCIPEIIPSPWLIDAPYPSTITMLDKNPFGIPVNVAIKIGVLKDFFYPVHDWFSMDFHHLLEVAKLNCDRCCFKLINSSQCAAHWGEEGKVLAFIDKLVAWSSILYICFAFLKVMGEFAILECCWRKVSITSAFTWLQMQVLANMKSSREENGWYGAVSETWDKLVVETSVWGHRGWLSIQVTDSEDLKGMSFSPRHP